MEQPEDNADWSEDHKLPDERRSSNGHESSFSCGTGHAEEPAIDSREIELSRDWIVEVVQGRASDAANRISRAIEILLDAAAHPRD